jgi:RNA polymerase sigma factor (TIGR02999 family)
MPPPEPVTAVLRRVQNGDGSAVDALLPFVYDELQALARGQLRRERGGHTLDATALVHEAYLKLVDQREADWQNRAHFFGVAALAMRRVLIHYAEKRRAAKRGGGIAAITLIEDGVAREAPAEEVLALDEALTRLAAFAPRAARVVELRFFGGLTQGETAEVLGVSVPTVQRDWQTARAWLGRELGDDAPEAP